MTLDNFESLLEKYFTFWDHLSADEKNLLLSNAALKQYGKGQSLHNGNDDCIGVFLVNRGTLRTYILSEEGREITLYRLYEGEMCVLSASCVLSSINFDVHIDAETDCEILLISSSAFAEVSRKNIYVECFTYKQAADRFTDVMLVMQQILFMSFDRRLAIFLWEELSTNEPGNNTISLTHEQVAKYMGSAREVVTRMLNYFASEGIVELSRGGIKIMDRQKLRSLL
ncbi:MAG: Crp/Fnr family transcriptional regulator [Clostridiales bacterium]|nr:Crp/Fnr family transcriptional regulator [Clostridiales bacterium]